ncbi:MAG: NADH-quinone oxidoreductase subunit N [Fibrobacterota bacterium]|nr:NADH-quinone oxidoreductase subunit N [Fibrobacterota bacterium]QQS07188.1 MAG: NADH-quinone oxidoreductase subunit N [Fibrobacterota bacterium]
MNDFFLQVLTSIPVSLRGLFPELLVATAICLGLILEWSTATADKRLVVWFAAISALAGILLCLVVGIPGGVSQIAGTFVPDAITQFIRVFALVAAFLALLALNGSRAMARRDELGDAALLILSVALGAMLLASSRHLLAMYIGLEFLSLSSYGLAGFRARDPQASEAGIKYVLYGAVASAVAIFGISHLWGITGTFEVTEIGTRLISTPSPAVFASVALVAAAFAFKLGLAPFHFWSPDVYQGCPTVPAGFLSTVPKAAGFAAILHTLPELLPLRTPGLAPTSLAAGIVAMAVLSIVVGSATALVQNDAKRLLAFSSTANSGIMLLAISTWITRDAVAALGLYLMAYMVANLGAFLALDILSGDGDTSLANLKGSWKRRPRVVVALVICVASLAGIPPLAGFAGKWALLSEVVRTAAEDGYGKALLIGVVFALAGSVALAGAYLRLLRATVVDDDAEGSEHAYIQPAFLAEVPLLLCTGASIVLGAGFPLLTVFHSCLAGG